MDHSSSSEESLMRNDDEEFMGGVFRIMIAWTIAVVAIGIALVFLRNSFNVFGALVGVF